MLRSPLIRNLGVGGELSGVRWLVLLCLLFGHRPGCQAEPAWHAWLLSGSDLKSAPDGAQTWERHTGLFDGKQKKISHFRAGTLRFDCALQVETSAAEAKVEFVANNEVLGKTLKLLDNRVRQSALSRVGDECRCYSDRRGCFVFWREKNLWGFFKLRGQSLPGTERLRLARLAVRRGRRASNH